MMFATLAPGRAASNSSLMTCIAGFRDSEEGLRSKAPGGAPRGEEVLCAGRGVDTPKNAPGLLLPPSTDLIGLFPSDRAMRIESSRLEADRSHSFRALTFAYSPMMLPTEALFSLPFFFITLMLMLFFISVFFFSLFSLISTVSILSEADCIICTFFPADLNLSRGALADFLGVCGDGSLEGSSAAGGGAARVLFHPFPRPSAALLS
mmetsp:Transcript_44819/g.112414  ORF Transcript_44819/g.112414 Transcript_44819/m.112414 type:complete len:207 (-) Transcript_44819:3482-4102(-)